MKITVTIISTNAVANTLATIFCSFVETKNKKQGSRRISSLVARNLSIFCKISKISKLYVYFVLNFVFKKGKLFVKILNHQLAHLKKRNDYLL